METETKNLKMLIFGLSDEPEVIELKDFNKLLDSDNKEKTIKEISLKK